MQIAITDANYFEAEVVAGANPELADLSNPDGFFYEKVYQIVASTSQGQRFLLNQTFAVGEDLGKVVALVSQIRARGVIALEFWSEHYPVYGSQAWGEEDVERQTGLAQAVRHGDREAIERLA